MKRSKKKLSKQGKTLIIFFIISVILLLWTFIPSKNNLTIEYHEIEEEANYTLKIDYPSLENDKIQNEVIKFIKDKKESFLKSAKELAKISQNNCDLAITYTLEDLFNYKALYINVYSYTGGAHYNRENKKRYGGNSYSDYYVRRAFDQLFSICVLYPKESYQC